MKLTNLKIEDLISEDLTITFLVGAGCSVDPPSCIPTAPLLMEAIIKHTCAPREVNKLLQLKELRFEQLIEIIRDSIDPLLDIIEYFEQFDEPNHQHLFLAKMIQKGNFVMTTNFDFLIESALQQLGVPDEDIITVITEEDFHDYPDPNQLFKEGKKMLYKIHGSTKNSITGESTKDSLIATIEALGHGKKGMDIFQVEPFKLPFFNNITGGRSLIVMGYSGSDDFDIGPTLRILNNLDNFIWIYHDETQIKEKIYEIEEQDANEPDKINQILSDIKEKKNACQVYRVDANTSKLIESLLDIKIYENTPITSEEPLKWLKENIEISSAEYYYLSSAKFYYLIPYKIYLKLQRYEDAIRCFEMISELCDGPQYLELHLELHNTMGEIYVKLGRYSEAEDHFKTTLKILEELRDNAGKALTLYYLGFLYYEQGRISDALKVLNEGFHMADYYSHIALYLNQFGLIYYARKNYSKALKKINEALEIYEELEDLSGKAKCFNNIALIYTEQKKYEEAIKWCDSAYKIFDQLEEPFGKTSCLANKGNIYRHQRKYKEAMKLFNDAIKICKDLDFQKEEAVILSYIGILYKDQEWYDDAIDVYEEILDIDDEIGDIWRKPYHLSQLSSIYQMMDDEDKEYELNNEALEIFKDLGNLDGKAMMLKKIGKEYEKYGSYEWALYKYKDVLFTYQKLKNYYEKANLFKHIGTIYKTQGNYSKALKSFECAVLFYEKTGDKVEGGLACLEISKIHGILNNEEERIKYYNKARPFLKYYYKR